MRTEAGILTVKLFERGLVVEEIDLRRPAGHEQVDDSVWPWG